MYSKNYLLGEKEAQEYGAEVFWIVSGKVENFQMILC